MYPKKYKNISKKELMREDVHNKALIIFITDDLDTINPEEYPDLYTPNVIKISENSYDTLFVNAEDICKGLSKDYRAPSETDFLNINNFLVRNSEKEIVAVCDAGISRSGFVTFFLDVKNDNIDDVSYQKDYNGGSIFSVGKRGTSYRRYLTNSALTDYLLSSNVLTPKELEKIEDIVQRDT